MPSDHKFRQMLVMSNMASIIIPGWMFYNSWVKFMSPLPFLLFCSWHVNRTCRKNLIEIKVVRNKQIRTNNCFEERDQAAFVHMLPQVINAVKSNNGTRDFVSYSENEYKDSVKRWTCCFSLHAG